MAADNQAHSDSRTLALRVHGEPVGGLPRSGLMLVLGWPQARFERAMWIAYRRGMIDFVRDYVVAANPAWANPAWRSWVTGSSAPTDAASRPGGGGV